jgi:hypothetical protein
MKRVIIAILATVGALAIAALAARTGIRLIVPSYETMARRDFAGPSALAEIESLYKRLESSPKDPELKIVRSPAYRKGMIRLVPRTWMREPLSPIWGRVAGVDSMISWGDVIGYYDEKDELIGMEFYGSRYGCFVSRDPMLCPSWFRTLRRVSGPPLYVNLRVTDDE